MTEATKNPKCICERKLIEFKANYSDFQEKKPRGRHGKNCKIMEQMDEFLHKIKSNIDDINTYTIVTDSEKSSVLSEDDNNRDYLSDLIEINSIVEFTCVIFEHLPKFNTTITQYLKYGITPIIPIFKNEKIDFLYVIHFSEYTEASIEILESAKKTNELCSKILEEMKIFIKLGGNPDRIRNNISKLTKTESYLIINDIKTFVTENKIENININSNRIVT
jgi:hypothetical protein